MSDIRVLIVDDEKDYSETMEFWLLAKGFDVTTVSSGIGAIDYLENNPLPDIIFLDILMPGMDGIKTLKEIKKLHPKLPVIMVSAYATEDRMEEACRLGASNVFSKMDDFSEAARLIKTALEEFELLEELEGR